MFFAVVCCMPAEAALAAAGWGASLRLRCERQAEEHAAPVVLHYANCGASAQDFAMSCGSERWILDRQ